MLHYMRKCFSLNQRKKNYVYMQAFFLRYYAHLWLFLQSLVHNKDRLYYMRTLTEHITKYHFLKQAQPN